MYPRVTFLMRVTPERETQQPHRNTLEPRTSNTIARSAIAASDPLIGGDELIGNGTPTLDAVA